VPGKIPVVGPKYLGVEGVVAGVYGVGPDGALGVVAEVPVGPPVAVAGLITVGV
jgi:hypothetical protein